MLTRHGSIAGFRSSTQPTHYKRALGLDDRIVVKTQADSYAGARYKVNFRIEKKDDNKIAAEGYLIYTMISIESGKPVKIPEDLAARYSI